MFSLVNSKSKYVNRKKRLCLCCTFFLLCAFPVALFVCTTFFLLPFSVWTFFYWPALCCIHGFNQNISYQIEDDFGSLILPDIVGGK